MNIKNITKITIFIITIISIVIFINNINNKEKINSDDLGKYKDADYIKKLNPISKENAINILKAEYGDIISISEDEIKQVGDEYVVEVHTQFKNEEEEEYNYEHDNQTSLGIHKINIYTGELTLQN